MNTLVRMRDIHVRRGGRAVLEIGSLEVEKGEVLALIGPNGAGKTTLLYVLGGLLKAERGEIIFAGRPLEEWNLLEYRRRISIVFQAPLLLDMTVFDNAALGLRFRGLPREEVDARVHKWLMLLGIETLAKRRAVELSGGEAQRVSLARAFVLDPELLLLDEPFSALDPSARQKLMEDLSSLLADGERTVVLVTHNLQEAAQMGQRVGVIVGGRIRQVGPARQIKARPADAEVAAFLKELPR